MRGFGAVVVFCGLASGCFADAKDVCTEGTKDCPCLALACEAGLQCQDAVCVAPGAGSETGATATAGSGDDAVTTQGTSAVDDSTTADPTVGATDASATTDTTADTSGGSSSTGVELCGNGQLDPDEECDGTPGCEATCELTNYDCNPLNNAPCPNGFKCSAVEPEGVPITTECLPFAEPPPGQLFESNCVFGGTAHDEWCDVGLACSYSQATDACEVNCCVEFCDLTDARFECAFPGDVCRPFFTVLAPDGLAQVGYCIRP